MSEEGQQLRVYHEVTTDVCRLRSSLMETLKKICFNLLYVTGRTKSIASGNSDVKGSSLRLPLKVSESNVATGTFLCAAIDKRHHAMMQRKYYPASESY